LVALLTILCVAERGRSEDPTKPPVRVGQIFIVGNTRTPMSAILSRVRLYPGQILDMAELAKTEERLARLDRFVVDPGKGIRPTVTLVDNPNDPKSEYKDILITIEEKESTPFLCVVCDALDEWGYLLDRLDDFGYLLDVRTRVLIRAALVCYLFYTYCR
jgi:hypothetical protein